MTKRFRPSLASDRSHEKSGEPLAIVGIGCRLPGGVDDVQGFWNLVRDGIDAIIDVPGERWDLKSFYDADAAKTGKMHCPRGGFLRRPVDLFDAGFFGMSPREAARLDPQQRMLLEVAWEALEDAGQRPSELVGSLTGVFIGGFMLDSLLYQLGRDNVPVIESHTATGMTMTMLSARLAYFLDLRGPTISVDTACSSSLVALHYACTSIWRGESNMALCGGVNAMLAPAMSIALAKGKLTSPDGRCKTFDASANGYARGEGAGMLVIKTLARALADGDHVYAAIRGTAVNQDGRSEHGITHPSKDAQVAVLRAAYARAGVHPKDVHYVEAHGTGTIAGDTTETAALGTVIGEGRAAAERFVAGSVKTNVGHLEGAAGVTGVIKAALSLHHEQIAPNLHFKNPNPEIAFDALHIRVAVAPEAWPRGNKPRYAGVNSFGYGGTNAHVVLEEAPLQEAQRERQARAPWLLPLSARSEAALKTLALRYADRIEASTDAMQLEDIVHSAAVRRDHHDWRVGFVAQSSDEMAQGLRAYAAGKPHPTHAAAHVTETPKKVAWVFTGMGPQWWGMGRELMRDEPVFREAVEALDAVFKTFGGWSFVEELARPETESRMDSTEIAMSCNFAIQAGLVALWRSFGMEPDVIVGHSVGEMGAAYAAGALSLEDAARVAFFRSSIMRRAAGTGRMLATGLSVDEAHTLLIGREHLVSVAAINGPTNVTLSGDAAVLEEIDASLEKRGVFHKFLRVEVPYHSPQMDPLKEALAEALQSLRPTKPLIPLYSTVTTEQVTDASLDNRYWVRNMRESVFFSTVIEKMLADGCTHFVEVGPHSVLAVSIAEVAKRAGKTVSCASSMLRQKPERGTLLGAVRQLYIDGREPDWSALGAIDARYVRVPTYPWQRERHWAESGASASHRLGPKGHPLIGHRLQTPSPVWEAEVGSERHPFMVDHCIAGEVLFPASGYLEAARAMLDAWQPGNCWSLDHVAFSSAFVLGGVDATFLRGSLDAESGRFAFHSRTSSDASTWTLNTSGRFHSVHQERPVALDVQSLRKQLTQTLDHAAIYAGLKRRGYDYGPNFRQVQAVHYQTQTLFMCDVTMPPTLLAGAAAYTLHPAMLDACLHASLALLPSDGQNTYLPVGVDHLVCYEALPQQVVVVVKVVSLDGQELRADLTLCAPDGRVLVELEGMQAHAVGAIHAALNKPLADWLYTHNWQVAAGLAAQDTRLEAERWLVLDDGHGLGTKLCARVQQLGGRTLLVEGGEPQQMLSTLGDFNPTKILSLLDAAALDDRAPTSTFMGIDGVVRLTLLMQQMAQYTWKKPPQLVVVTRGAEILAVDKAPHLGRAAIAGFMRTAMNEHVEFHARVVDVERMPSPNEAEMLVTTLARDVHETEMALRGGQYFVRRFERATQDNPPGYTPRWVSPNAVTVALHGATLAALPTPILGETQVEIQVLAAGVLRTGSHALRTNFISGRVARVGAQVTTLQKGAEVVAWTICELASFVVLDATSVMPKPLGLPHASAASLDPVCLAHHVLLQVARVGKADVVLIPDDGSMFATAAAHITHSLGAVPVVIGASAREVTGGAFIAARDAGLGRRVRELTHGRGADVVLCQSGEQKGMLQDLIATDGCFVDMSADGQAHGSQLRASVTYVPVGRADASARQTRSFGKSLGEVMGMVASKVYRAPACHEVRFDELPRSQDVSGTVVQFHADPVQAISGARGYTVVANGSYLITGGLGGLGIAMATWLARRGAGHLILTGRQGAASAEAQKAVRDLEALGVKVTAVAADVANAAQMAQAVDAALQNAPPLRGVIHAASTFSSEFIFQFNADEMRRQMAAKAVGAFNLHTYTQDMPLEFFVTISSMAAQIGSHGQSAYAAANAFLDGLCVYRRATGKVSTSINLGAIGDVGILNTKADYGARLESVGLLAMSSDQVLESLDFMLTRGLDRLTVSHMRWPAFFEGFPAMKQAPTFANLWTESQADRGAAQDQDDVHSFEKLIAGLGLEERTRVLVEKLRELSAAVFGSTPEQVNTQTPLQKMGLDSLMASQLRDKIEAELHLEVRIMTIVRGPSIEQLADTLLSQLSVSAAAPSLEIAGRVDLSALEDALADVEAMSQSDAMSATQTPEKR